MTEPPPPPRRRPPKKPPPTPAARRARRKQAETKTARLEIGKVYRGLRSLRGLFIVDGVVVGMVFLISFLGEPLNLLQLVSGVLLLGAVAGAVLVVRQPYPWCLSLAVGHSLLALLAPGIVTIGIAVVLWWAVVVAHGAHKLLKRYPDAWDGRNTSYTGRTEEQMGSKWRDRARADGRRRTRRVLLFIVTPIALLLVGVILFGGKDAEPERREVSPPTVGVLADATRFMNDWNRSDLDAVIAHGADSEQHRLRRVISKVIRRRKWQQAHPPAAHPQLEAQDPFNQQAVYALEGYGTLRVWWVWHEGKWRMWRVKFKKES